MAETAELLISELVTNSLEHADDGVSIVVLLMYAAGVLRLEVRDHDPSRVPEIRNTEPMDIGGRGLVIVAALSDRWGFRMTGTGKSVWCELAAPVPAAHVKPAPGRKAGDA